MSIADTTENAIMNLVFRAVAWTNYADNAASSPETNTPWALHTADPGDTGTMTTSEAAYGSYARTNVPRTTGGYSAASNGVVNPAANINFPIGTAGPGTGTFASNGHSGAGSQAILFSGAVSPSIAFGNGVTPVLSTATAISLD